MNAVAHQYRRLDALGYFQQRQPGALDQSLHQHAFDQAVSERGWHWPAITLDGALEGGVDEQDFRLPGDTDEADQIGLGNGAPQSTVTLTDFQVLPQRALAELRDGIRHGESPVSDAVKAKEKA